MRNEFHEVSDTSTRYRLRIRFRYQQEAKARANGRFHAAPSIESLFGLVAETLGHSVEGLRQRVKIRQYAEARHLTVLLARAAGHSYPRIGEAMARDHTTAVHSYSRALALFDHDARFREKIARVIAGGRASGFEFERFRFERAVLSLSDGGAS
jgi:chromosomal replication initiation ATPase DnaA